ncbi:hypothetical protein HYH03_009546 [Edaphochlamys debaryana]|uniref:Uncharacterized protein n=1 Tax=Edaphochlamys debaryana TaxID=47281 RepID=A0A835XXI7_9CHLO|nr:hypothetical protein HYH03_009546 [Edaphochlamys debaryana]|eukprot:KAG2492048.1 hypothetical protein HYH03_009546 [Edaphochlamys debaryana]
MTCVNEHQPSLQGRSQPAATTWETTGRFQQSPLRIAGVWISRRQQPPRDTFPVTVVTQLSVGRLAQLEALCRSWAGPLAAAVWLPLVLKGKNGSSGKSSNVTYSLGTIDDGGLKLSDNHRNVISREAAVINALHQRAEQAGPCQLDLMLVYELYESDKMASLLYPVNVMRNLARLMARTPMMGAFDADMMVGGELADELATNATAAVDLVRRVMGNTTRGREAAERAERGAVAGAALYAVTAAERAKARAAEAAAEAQAAEARAAAAQARVKELQSRTASGAGAGAATAARRLLRGLPSLLKLSRWHQRSTQGSDGEDDGEEEGDGDDGEDGGEEGEGQQEDEDEDDGDAMSAEVSAAEAALEAALAAATGSDPTPSSSSTSPSASTSTPASATSGAASTGAKPSSAQGHPTDGRVAVVLPAFTTDWKMTSDQTWPTELAETLALRSTNKTLLSKWYKIKSLRRFNPKGSTHHNTDTSRWLKTHEWYNVSYRFMYEPWVLVDRLTSPWHDIRFRG